MIVLSKEQLEWLNAQVAEGRFASVETGVEAALLALRSDIEGEEHDDWVKPLLEEARASGSVSLEEFNQNIADWNEHRRGLRGAR